MARKLYGFDELFDGFEPPRVGQLHEQPEQVVLAYTGIGNTRRLGRRHVQKPIQFLLGDRANCDQILT